MQLELLMMSGVPLETCRAFNERWNNKFHYKVAFCWLFLLSHTSMHGSMNIKSFFNLCARWKWVVKATFRPLYRRERHDTYCVGCRRTTGPVWTGKENLAPAGIQSPDRPARSESLYRLSYPGPRSRGTALLILNSGSRRKWVFNIRHGLVCLQEGTLIHME
jgi:hypothetical protein